ncbi:AbiU2 domain-containing protein [Vibrio parahaemolyticus]|uniref:AbiU2 domain-containing protein n=2 Tax=Vibrio parahaemolyticus TaxID=670 RepID=UPI001D16D463|nr:hypothetical protein [Vibrio parahaemolyticus]MCC3789068.1 hypothetical protein [Vibrio parahaemolyticus]MCC3836618.1 hypothetical protein [Vibrio parahaemolyticus]
MNQSKQELKRDLVRVKEKLTHLNSDLTLYNQLFSDRENVQVLNSSGALVFHRFQQCLIDSIYMSISRLLDPAKTMGSKNLSFAHLASEFGLQDDTEVAEELALAITQYQDSKLKDYRNKVLSHNAHKTEKLDFYPFNTVLITELLHRFWKIVSLIEFKAGLVKETYTMSLEVIFTGV